MPTNSICPANACLLGVLPLLLCGLAWADPASSSIAGTGLPPAGRQAELLNLVRQDCGSCHGLTLAGGLGLSLLPAALQGKDPEGLKHTVLSGRPGTAMPGWRPFMSEAEAEWIVQILMKGLPDAR